MNVHHAFVQAIAGNAPHWEPDAVLSQAIEGLALEAEALIDLHETSRLGNTTIPRLYSLASRLRVLETFVGSCLSITYRKECEDAFAFDASEEPAPEVTS